MTEASHGARRADVRSSGDCATGSVIPGSAAAPGVADLYLRRTRLEMEELADVGLALAGSATPTVLMLKGTPGPAELEGGALLSGPDGKALRAALARLGYPDDGWAAASTFLREGFAPADPADVAFAVEAFDPEAVVALDPAAARALESAWGLPSPLADGVVERVRGRRAIALGGFEAALSDAGSKQVVWAYLKRLPPLGPPL